MTLDELERACPAFADVTRTMPTDVRARCRVQTHPAGSIVHRKDALLTRFGIVAWGESRVINEFENGSVYMIERNRPIDFVGEVAMLAGMERASVTIEAVTDMTVAYISREDAERWLASDIEVLRRVAGKVAYKLYRSSYSNGAKLFYPPAYLLMDYLVRYGEGLGMVRAGGPERVIVAKTRQALQEELGINVKTLSRTIRQLKEEGLLGTEHGKVSFSSEQLARAVPWLVAAGRR